jgi:hypothetical protein
VLAFSIFTAVLSDFFSGPLSSVLEASLFTGAALYGAVIYRLQIAAVKRLKTFYKFHVTSRGNERKAVFKSTRDREIS